MAIEFSPHFRVRSRKLKEWEAAERMGTPSRAPTERPVVRLDELIAAQALEAEQRASGDGG